MFENKITSVYPMQDVRVSSIATSEKPLADLKAGSVTVCTGKACVRNGRALVVLDTLSNHFAGTTVSTGECKCMGACKQATNIKIEDESGFEVMIGGLTPDKLAAMLPGIKVPELV